KADVPSFCACDRVHFAYSETLCNRGCQSVRRVRLRSIALCPSRAIQVQRPSPARDLLLCVMYLKWAFARSCFWFLASFFSSGPFAIVGAPAAAGRPFRRDSLLVSR